MADKVEAAMAFARQALQDAENPMDGMSPDGYCEAAASAAAWRQLLGILCPEEWCPPHFYSGQTGMVPGECVLTCELCGDRFVGRWNQEGRHERPVDALECCERCNGAGWLAHPYWKSVDAGNSWSVELGDLCSTCGGAGTELPRPVIAATLRARRTKA
jgi:hypothetical protein